VLSHAQLFAPTYLPRVRAGFEGHGRIHRNRPSMSQLPLTHLFSTQKKKISTHKAQQTGYES